MNVREKCLKERNLKKKTYLLYREKRGQRKEIEQKTKNKQKRFIIYRKKETQTQRNRQKFLNRDYFLLRYIEMESGKLG